MKTSHKQSRRAGYVLLLTLILLAMVAAGLAGVARRSHAASLEANRVERETQRRWLAVTAETLLRDSDQILTDQGLPGDRSMAAARFEFDLGHHHLTLTLADEQAKANLNTLAARHDHAVVSAKANALAAGTASNLRPRLRPIGEFEATAAGVEIDWPAFGSWEQVLSADDLGKLLNGPPLENTFLNHITLWGDGRLRVDRASRPALEAMLTPLLSTGQIEQMLAERMEHAVESSAVGISGLELTDRQREQLAERLTDESQTFSIRLRFDDQRRARYHMVVQQTAAASSNIQTFRFDW